MTVVLCAKPLAEQAINLSESISAQAYANQAYIENEQKTPSNGHSDNLSTNSYDNAARKKSCTKSSLSEPVFVVPIGEQRKVSVPIVPTRSGKNTCKNLLCISFGFFSLFLAFSALSDLQSSLNPSAGLGTISLSVMYAILVLSCMFAPSFIISKIGCKRTLIVMSFLYSFYAAANFYPVWGTLIPASAIVGIASAPLWSAKCTYLTQMGTEYAAFSNKKPSDLIVRMFGFFFMVLQCGRIVGNLISSLILNQGMGSHISAEQLQVCGANYCNEMLPIIDTNQDTMTNETNGTSTTTSQIGKDKVHAMLIDFSVEISMQNAEYV